MAKSKSVSKFSINENSIYVYMVWKPNNNDLFHIKIYDGEKSWSGEFSYELARKNQERLDENEEEYFNTVKDSLMKQADFSYSFVSQSNDNKTAMFTWKKKFIDSDCAHATLVHGSVPVHVEESCKGSLTLLDFLIETNNDLRNHANNLTTRIKMIEDELETYKSNLKKHLDIKASLEKTLFYKFSQVINSKKRRIQVLEDSISELEKRPKTIHATD